MKCQLRIVLGLLALQVACNGPAPGNHSQDVPESQGGTPEKTAQANDQGSVPRIDIFRRLQGHIKLGDFRAAFAIMTPRMADEFAAEYLFLAAELSRGEATTDLERTCTAIAQKFGFAEAIPEEYFEGDEFSTDEFTKLLETANRNLLASMDEDKLDLALQEIHRALLRTAGGPGQELSHPFYADEGVTKLFSTESADTLGVSIASETIYLKFKQTDSGWLWDGYDEPEQALATGRSYPVIEDLVLSGTTVSGESVNLTDYQGKVVLIDFWGTWCVPCVAELPTLKKIYQELHEKGFEIIGVAADDREPLSRFLEQRDIPWKNILDDEKIIVNRLRIKDFPTTFLVDKEGQHIQSNLSGKELLQEVVHLLELDFNDHQGLLEEIDDENHN